MVCVVLGASVGNIQGFLFGIDEDQDKIATTRIDNVADISYSTLSVSEPLLFFTSIRSLSYRVPTVHTQVPNLCVLLAMPANEAFNVEVAYQSVLHFTLVDRHITLKPDQLHHFHPEGGWRGDERGLVGINQRTVPHEIDLVWVQPLRLLEKFPEDEQSRSYTNHRVVCEEPLNGKCTWLEREITIHRYDYYLEDERDPGSVRLEVTAVGQHSAIETLDLTSFVEG